jgi:hypothetical protein
MQTSKPKLALSLLALLLTLLVLVAALTGSAVRVCVHKCEEWTRVNNSHITCNSHCSVQHQRMLHEGLCAAYCLRCTV